ncbi:MAG: hypothetical protein LBQ98_10240 [Nitrososphaerota archaeon]|nr:hypothetical protein [Nitrososphaerota archaeon]
MKAFQGVAISIFFISIFLCISIVSALGPNDAAASAQWSNSSPQAGDTVTIRFSFQSNVPDTIQLYGIGIHADWMPPNQLAGPRYTSGVTVIGRGSYTSDPYPIVIPSSASLGTHTYFVGIDAKGADGEEIIWDSADYTITIGTKSTTPPPTGSSPTKNPEKPTDRTTQLFFIAVTVIVIVVLVILLMLRKKSKTTSPTARPINQQPPNNPPPPPTPKDEPSDPQDFTI